VLDWVALGLDSQGTLWIGLGVMTMTLFKLVITHCSTVDAVSFKLWFMNV